MHFAIEDLKPLDPDIQTAFQWIMGIMFALLVGVLFLPL